MAVIHIFKDGTTKTELKDVYVPKEVVKRLEEIASERRKHEKKEA